MILFHKHIYDASSFGSGSERSLEDPNDFDNIMGSITDLEISSEKIRSFLPKVNWEQLASMYIAGRSAAECEARLTFHLNYFFLYRMELWTSSSFTKLPLQH